jgi:hypothetical protein
MIPKLDVTDRTGVAMVAVRRGLGHLHKEGNGYSWAPVAFTDLWAER